MIERASQYTIRALPFASALATFIPWLLPVTYAALIWAQTQGYDPTFICLISIWWAIIWTSTIRLLDTYFTKRVKKYIKIPLKRRKEHMWAKDAKDTWWFKRKIKWLNEKLQVTEKKRVLFFLVIVTTYSIIPDILLIKYVRNKISFLVFLIAVTIWKSLIYIPVIYWIEFIEYLTQFI